MPSRASRPVKILLVDDDPLVRSCLSLSLRGAGFVVTTADASKTALKHLAEDTFELLMIDLVMPGMNGLDLVRKLKKENAATPIIILTGHGTLDTAIESLRLGVKDYILKPNPADDTIDRVRQVIKEHRARKQRTEIMQDLKDLVTRWDGANPQRFTFPQEDQTINHKTERALEIGPIHLDLLARTVRLNNQSIHLSPTSFDYLEALVRHAPHPVSPEALLRESQGYRENAVKSREIVRWRIHQLRKALEPDSLNPRYIITVRGAGYRLAV